MLYIMNRLVILILSLVFSAQATSAFTSEEKLSMSGFYQNKNLFIQNRMDQDGFGYSIRSIRINGNIYHGVNNKKAIEIDFNSLDINDGDAVEVLISYEGPSPKILNPHSILPKSTCIYKNVTHNGSTIQFSTLEENGSLSFHIQHYRWNKWIDVGQVRGEGESEENTYEYKVVPNSGENLYRVVQHRQGGDYNISPFVTIQGPDKNVEYERNGDIIKFTRKTYFEVHDVYGNLLKKGFGDRIALNIKDDIALYLSYDNATDLVK